MRILSIQAPRVIKSLAIAAPLLLASPIMKAHKFQAEQDVFVKTEACPCDSIDKEMLCSPVVEVANDTIYPAVVVDISEGKLYHYNLGAYLEDVYPIASGKKSTPTKPALKVITGIEKYPYKSAPKATKRYKNPNDYGTYLLNLSNIDLATGKITGSDGQFIHGAFNPESIGKKVTKGCVRVNNDVIEILADRLSVGQYVLIRE